jgi:membrane glycosyltransferase
VRWLSAGLAATTLITVFALVDPVSTRFIAAQVEAGYPSYTQAQIDDAVALYVGILVSVGTAGIIGWITALLLVWARKRAAFWTGTVLGAIGVLIAATALATRDTSGTIGLAPVFGWLLLIPCAIGAAALVTMRRGHGSTRRALAT